MGGGFQVCGKASLVEELPLVHARRCGSNETGHMFEQRAKDSLQELLVPTSSPNGLVGGENAPVEQCDRRGTGDRTPRASFGRVVRKRGTFLYNNCRPKCVDGTFQNEKGMSNE